MSEEKPSLAESLYERRNFVLAMLSVPIIGMAIAVVLIIYKRPDSMVAALAVILFLAAQYTLMMFFWYKRLEGIIAKKEEAREAENEGNKSEVEQVNIPENVLVPEEKRVFPTEEE